MLETCSGHTGCQGVTSNSGACNQLAKNCKTKLAHPVSEFSCAFNHLGIWVIPVTPSVIIYKRSSERHSSSH